MSENWRIKLEETCFDDLSQQERDQLLEAMEQDQELRKKVISDLRFENVLRETFRTEENPAYKEQIASAWSPEKVHREMVRLGMNPKSLTSEPIKGWPFNKWALGIILMGGMVFVMMLVPNSTKSNSSKQDPKLTVALESAEATGDLDIERQGELKSVKKTGLLDGDILSTQKNGWAELTLGDGVFIEMSRQAQVKWLVHETYKEIRLIKGRVTVTFAKRKAESSKVVLSTKYLTTEGDGVKFHATHKKIHSQIEVLEGRTELKSQLNQEAVEMARSGEIWRFDETGKGLSVQDTREKLGVDLVAWWSMDDGQGKTINDFSGSGFQGSLASHVKLAEGLRGQALKISEINRKNLVIPHSPDLNIHPVKGITVMSWIKTTRIDTATILDKRFGQKEGGKYFGYQMVLVRGRLSFQMDDGRTLIFHSREFVADGNWHHICVSVTRGNVEKGTFYVDGNEVGSFDSSEIGNTDSPGPLNIGGHVDLDEHAFVGYIDEVRVYRRGLNQEEIQSVMNQTD